MAGRVEGKVAFITGAARGQGRAHAVRLAQEGADIIAVDICKQIDSVRIPLSTPEDLAETADMVKNLDRRIYTAEVDTRDFDALKAAVDAGVEQLGRLDIIVANAGIGNGGETLDKTSEGDWEDMIDVNLGGVWKTVKAGVPTSSPADAAARSSSPARSAALRPTRTPATTSRPNTVWSA